MLNSRVQSVTPTLWGCKDGASRTQWSLLQLLRRSLFSRQIWRKVTKRFQNICLLPTYLTPFQGKIVGLEEVMDASVTKLLLLSLMDQKVSVPFRQAFPGKKSVAPCWGWSSRHRQVWCAWSQSPFLPPTFLFLTLCFPLFRNHYFFTLRYSDTVLQLEIKIAKSQK